MKVALFTIWHEMNYGAELQAYAMIRALRELGHDVTLIDLRLEDMRPTTPKEILARLIVRLSPNYHNFQKFWKKNILPYSLRYKSLLELSNRPPEADLYLVGSDQTWNPAIMGELFTASLLDFGSKNIIRASYASSFGENELRFSKTEMERMDSALKRFQFVSCREVTGCNLLEKHFHVESINVLDPTLLHDDYSEIVANVEQKQTIAYYPLSLADKESKIYAEKLGRILNLCPVNVNDVKVIKGSLVWNRTSISEWLSQIAGSQFVITKSFHGLAFSLIFKRQFAIVNNSSKNSRISDLLSILGLNNRLFPSYEELMNSKIWEKPIDYSVISERMSTLRKNSWDYLKQLGK